MSSHIVIDGNAFYEVDDACMREKEKERERLRKDREKKSGEEKEKKQRQYGNGGMNVRQSPEKCVIVFLTWKQMLAKENFICSAKRQRASPVLRPILEPPARRRSGGGHFLPDQISIRSRCCRIHSGS